MSAVLGARQPVRDLEALAVQGLKACSSAGGALMPFTLRGTPGANGPSLSAERASLRYTAIVALGLGRHSEATQREALGGRTAADLARSCLDFAAQSVDPGAVAISVWAAAEVAGDVDDDLTRRLERMVTTGRLATVDCSWAVVAGLATGDERHLPMVAAGVETLLAHQGPQGVFPHELPAARGVRAHVGSFADQIYPVQALSRYSARTGDRQALDAAELTARRLVDLQGPGGQWWWHYDARTGEVVERFPVYSVHQHGMAPMVFADLEAAGGSDYGPAVELGRGWIWNHPETVQPMAAPELGVIWRKVGRQEPRKASRLAGAVATRVRPGGKAPFVDRLWPSGRVDHECRPYELGWLLYAAGGCLKGASHE